MSTLPEPGILARGPWAVDAVTAHWQDDHFEAPAERVAAADAAIQALRDRDSPSHDGLSARLVGFEQTPDGLRLELQPIRWALRLVEGDASASMAALCVTRDAAGRWLAGRRSAWLSSWPGRWTLGAGGSVDVGESPAETLARELQEEWAIVPERVCAEALVRLPQQMVMLIGQAWLAPGVEEQLEMDPEHDAHAWWPADPADWPAEADEPLRRVAGLLLARR
jgi:8-oxo-dGTP diphosphatase